MKVSQENMNPHERIQGKEINLVELLFMVWERRLLVFIITGVATLFLFLFANYQKPIYEVKAVVEIGAIVKQGESESFRQNIENVSSLISKLDFIYNDNIPEKEITRINSVQLLAGSEDLIVLQAQSTSNELAIEFINNILDDLKQRHEIFMVNYRKNLRKKLELFELKRNSLVDVKSGLLKSIEVRNERINSLINTYKDVAAVYSLNLSSQSDGEELKVLSEDIYLVEKDILNTNMELQPHNTTETLIVGSIVVRDNPIKPNKILFVLLGMVGGLIVSLLFVLILGSIEKYRKQLGSY
jgi:uncharacterized protein involved in exopolysaccharide biosynthesis